LIAKTKRRKINVCKLWGVEYEGGNGRKIKSSLRKRAQKKKGALMAGPKKKNAMKKQKLGLEHEATGKNAPLRLCLTLIQKGGACNGRHRRPLAKPTWM